MRPREDAHGGALLVERLDDRRPRRRGLWEGRAVTDLIIRTEGLEKDYEIEAISSPSGVTHVSFTRMGG